MYAGVGYCYLFILLIAKLLYLSMPQFFSHFAATLRTLVMLSVRAISGKVYSYFFSPPLCPL